MSTFSGEPHIAADGVFTALTFGLGNLAGGTARYGSSYLRNPIGFKVPKFTGIKRKLIGLSRNVGMGPWNRAPVGQRWLAWAALRSPSAAHFVGCKASRRCAW